MAPKALRRMLGILGRKLFTRAARDPVEYGQTLSKKRKKNCILTSVSSLSSLEEGGLTAAASLTSINFEFSRRPTRYRGSVRNFQKIDPGDSSCRRCCSDSASQSSVSSDSACDVTSTSSCDDSSCRFRERKKKGAIGTVENFIKIHAELDGEEPDYETLNPRASLAESDYDVLVSRATYSVLEPKYENLKCVESVYESPGSESFRCSDSCPFRSIKDLVHANRTYDEVIESLKVLHLKSHCWGAPPPTVPGFYETLERADNTINSYLEQQSQL